MPQLVPDRYPFPHIQDFSIISHGATVFLKLNLVHAYHHIPVEPVDIHKTAVTIPFGLFDSSGCHLGYKMVLKHSNALWTKFCMLFITVTTTVMTYS